MHPPTPPSSKSPALLPRLVFQVPGGARLEFVLDRDVLTIGRAPENEIVIEHNSVSRRHAQVMLQGAGEPATTAEANMPVQVLIQDLGSSNGTFVNGERLETGYPVRLMPGQTWLLGQVPAVVALGGIAAVVPEMQPVTGASSQAGTVESVRPTLPPRKASKARPALLAALIAGALLLLLLLVTGAVIGLRALRQGQERALAACLQPPMSPLVQGGVYYDSRMAQQVTARGAPNSSGPGVITPLLPAGGPQPILSTAFLELPFPYDGGNVNFGGTPEQFKLASQRNTGTGGRINSYFDHYLPLYPAPKDPGAPGGKEPAETPIAKSILLFDGLLNPYFSYSGHPALDYSVFEYRQPTTPLFAAADGEVFEVGTHGASGALFVRIKHTVLGVGDFLSIYWHLHPDEYFNAMLEKEGQFIQAGTRIGTMGNTGFSTGHHLHFEVRFDRDGNGIFSGSEVIDPYGFIPSVEFPEDPWFAQSSIRSSYLWVHPLGGAGVVGADGGGTLPAAGDTGGAFGDDSAAPAGTSSAAAGQFPICAQPGTFPAGSQVFFSWAPDPAPGSSANGATTVGTGNGCVLSVLDAQGLPLSQFEQPVTVVVPFDDSDLQDIDPDTLTIYWHAAGSDTWMPLETSLDFEQRIAVAQTDRPGKCSLMGVPTRDILPPLTLIEVAGARAEDGSIYETVTIKLSSDDPSGVQETHYSLDHGSTWNLYTGPFEVQPSGIPHPVVMDEEFFAGPPGTFMVLAYSVDAAGNIEEPPSSEYFSIDPSKNPDATLAPTATLTPTPTPTPTLTPTFTPSPSPTATQTPLSCDLTFTLSKNANCRKGPGTIYDVYTSYLTGQIFTVLGRSVGELNENTWFQVQAPVGTGVCWLSAAVGTVSEVVPGQAECLKTVVGPPTPTPKPPDTTPPPAPSLISPVDFQYSCTTQVELVWTEVSDPSGIEQYEWVLQQFNDGELEDTFSGAEEGTSAVVNVACGYQYSWFVRAVDGAGNAGPYSPAATFYNYGD